MDQEKNEANEDLRPEIQNEVYDQIWEVVNKEKQFKKVHSHNTVQRGGFFDLFDLETKGLSSGHSWR